MKKQIIILLLFISAPVFGLADEQMEIPLKTRKIDIVLVLDITGSMDLEVRRSLFDFGIVLHKKGITPRYCLVTFKDRVSQRCDQFVEDDPNTIENENRLDIEQKLYKFVGSGGGDRDENALGALEAAAEAPWAPGSQRIAILITDGGFHFGPEPSDIGDGVEVPTYSHAGAKLITNNVNTYVLAPKGPGYSQKFVGRDGSYLPDLATMTGGKWFDIRIEGTYSERFYNSLSEIGSAL